MIKDLTPVPTPAAGAAPTAGGPADQWRLRWFDPVAFGPQGVVALPAQPRALAVAEDGDAYVLSAPVRLARTSWLVRVDVHRGAVRSLGTVPGPSAGGPTVVGDRLYFPDPEGDVVSVLDRRTGAPLPAAGSGRGPVGVAFGSGVLAGGVGVGSGGAVLALAAVVRSRAGAVAQTPVQRRRTVLARGQEELAAGAWLFRMVDTTLSRGEPGVTHTHASGFDYAVEGSP